MHQKRFLLLLHLQDGKTALDMAVENKHWDVAEVLSDLGVKSGTARTTIKNEKEDQNEEGDEDEEDDNEDSDEEEEEVCHIAVS